jgi:hypothetical protein
MNNDITIFDCPNATLPFPQIDRFAAGNYDIFQCYSFLLELVYYLGAKKAGSPCQQNAFI